jgi:exodeoxyribonuclease-3
VSSFLDLGFKDSFRMFNPDPDHYTWWSFRMNSRARNKGWRIDYQMVTDELADACRSHIIYPEVVHSDHAAIHLKLEF